MAKRNKPAVKSLGVIGSLGSLAAILGLLTEIRRFVEANPELIDEGRLLIWAVISAVGSLVAFIGRVRAKLPIKGVFKSK